MSARWRVRRRAYGELSCKARAVLASVVVAAPLLLLATGNVTSGFLPGLVACELAGAPSGSFAEGLRAESVLDALSGDMTGRDAANVVLPEGFAEELLDVSGLEGLRVSDGGDVVGFLSRDGADGSFAALKGELEARGWAFVESGIENAGSFAKPDGAYRACFLSCTEVAGMTAVVIQCPRGDAGL